MAEFIPDEQVGAAASEEADGRQQHLVRVAGPLCPLHQPPGTAATGGQRIPPVLFLGCAMALGESPAEILKMHVGIWPCI